MMTVRTTIWIAAGTCRRSRVGHRLRMPPRARLACSLAGRSSRCCIRTSALSASTCAALSGLAYDHLGARTQAVCAIHHNFLPGIKTAIDDAQLPLHQAYLDGLNLRRAVLALIIRIHEPDKGSLNAILDCRRWDHQGIGPLFHHQVNVHKLVWEQGIIRIREHSLQLRRSGGGINLICLLYTSP